jgi:hypothetical protein
MGDDFWGYSEPNTWDYGQKSTNSNELKINKSSPKKEIKTNEEEETRGGNFITDAGNKVGLEGNIFEQGWQMAEGLMEGRQSIIDQVAQKTDDVVTGGLKKINMPGAEFIGDRARNIAGFTTDVATPELWELPLYGAATGLDPVTPIGEAGVYSVGVGKRLLMKGHLLSKKIDHWLGKDFDLFNPKGLFNRKQPITPEGVEVPNTFFKSTSSGGGGKWTLSTDQVQNKVLLDRLESKSLDRWLLGNTNKLSKKDANLIQEIASSEDFMSLMGPKFDALKKKYPGLVKKIGEKESLLLRWHHVNPSKGGIDLYKGLKNPADRMDLNRFLIDELGIYSGNHPLNNRGLSIDVHDQIHEWLGKRLGLRADVLKHKWAKKLGIDVGELNPGKGFMADHLVLSKEGRQAWDNYFSKLDVNQRKPFFKEYGKLIKESDGILDDLMKQYDALYAMPEGFQAVIPDEVLIEFLDNIPTDGSRLLQKDIRAIVEQVANDMPRGTLNIIDKAGDIKVLNLDSNIYKRLREVKLELDQAKDLRTKNSLKKELKDLEKGVYQQAIDFKGLEQQNIVKKRIIQDNLRREGKKNKRK